MALPPSELQSVLDAAFRIENPKAWLKKQRGESRTYISARRKKQKRRNPRRR